MSTAGLEWFGPPERNTLRPLCVVCLCSQEVENGIVRSESELVLCLPSLCLACLGFTYSSPLYLKGGVYIAVGSPTDEPSDVV